MKAEPADLQSAPFGHLRPRFTLFLLPLFPMGAGQTFTQCGRCGASFSGPVRQVARVVDRVDARQQQRAISLYNGMRASPANSVALNELMALYLSMGEPAQAVGAAADFPDALNASEQCMVTLSRAYMAAGKNDEAISWLDTALARNPESGEAHYRRATAYLNASPPTPSGPSPAPWRRVGPSIRDQRNFWQRRRHGRGVTEADLMSNVLAAMPRMSVWAAGLAVLAMASPARADPPSSPSTDLPRARMVQASVQQRFWDDRRQRYRSKVGKDDPAEMWAAGVAMSALDGAARYDPVTYRPLLLTYFDALGKYWDRDLPGGGYEPVPTRGSGDDKYYDDNEWMVMTFIEGAAVTGDNRMVDQARLTTDFVLTGWDDQAGGGIWWHEKHKGGGKNTCANGPGAVACLSLARALPQSTAGKYRVAARKIVEWTRAHLQNDDGRYADSINVETGKVARFSLTYNTALMIRAQLMLWRQTGAVTDRAEAEREARAADAFVNRRTGGYGDSVKWSHLQVEADLAVARMTSDAALATHVRRRARSAVDADFAAWKAKPSDSLIDVAALARELWLLVDADTTAGQAFWRKLDGPVMRPGR